MQKKGGNEYRPLSQECGEVDLTVEQKEARGCLKAEGKNATGGQVLTLQSRQEKMKRKGQSWWKRRWRC